MFNTCCGITGEFKAYAEEQGAGHEFNGEATEDNDRHPLTPKHRQVTQIASLQPKGPQIPKEVAQRPHPQTLLWLNLIPQTLNQIHQPNHCS